MSRCTETFVYRQDGTPLELLYTPTSTGLTQRYFYEVDGRGDVVALTDTNGQVVDRYGCDAWGAPTPQVSEQVPQPLWFAGYVYDRELGWYWLSTRSYDPNLKRFLQPDPSEQEGAQGYVYAGDDPFDATDPSGLWPCILGHGDCGDGGTSVNLAAAAGTIGLATAGVASLAVGVVGSIFAPEAAPVDAGLLTTGTRLLIGAGTLATGIVTGETIKSIQAHHATDAQGPDGTIESNTGDAAPVEPANAHLADLPVHPRYDRFNVRAAELTDPQNLGLLHGLDERQLEGSPELEEGHGGVRNLSNEDLMRFGGPNGTDPIRGYREYTPGDDPTFPGSRINLRGGHHRVDVIGERVRSGELSPDSLIEFQVEEG